MFINSCFLNAQIIDVKEIPETGRVIFGSTVKVHDVDKDKDIKYKIVGNLESDPEKGHISIDTPIAKELVGKFDIVLAEILPQLKNQFSTMTLLEENNFKNTASDHKVDVLGSSWGVLK